MPEAPSDGWRTYDEVAAGIATYRLPNTALFSRSVTVTLDDGAELTLAAFEDAEQVVHNGVEAPRDAVAVHGDAFFGNRPPTSVDGEALTVAHSTTYPLRAHCPLGDRRRERQRPSSGLPTLLASRHRPRTAPKAATPRVATVWPQDLATPCGVHRPHIRPLGSVSYPDAQPI
jgi:hypothetical protein